MKTNQIAHAILFSLATLNCYRVLAQSTARNFKQPQSPNSSPLEHSEGLGSRVVDFKQPPPDDNAPTGRTRGTGTRGECPIKVTPIIPLDSKGLTVAESPTIWFYVNYPANASTNNVTGEVSLEDTQTYNQLAPRKTTVSLPATSGVFSITLPHSLAQEQWYRWYLAINCNSIANSNSNSILVIEGLVSRVAPQNRLAATIQEEVASYAQQGIWYDALNSAATLACQNSPQDRAWMSLLNHDSVQLNEIAQVSLICQQETANQLSKNVQFREK